DGISNRVNYNEKGKVDGWIAEGYIHLKSKNFSSIEKVLEGLSNQVAINDIRFSVSPETMKVLEDELTLEVIKRFKHKAEVVQKGLNAKGYQLVDVQLNTLNSEGTYYGVRPMMAMAKSANYSEEMPLEAGKETISATASGKVKFE
ncbi:MAG: SIMPL domain-containing protein, partial [Haemophilus parahaemolyticus]|nr:SIMPL domain-containing protein [Haemophilus parahaemolyticus]